MFFGRAVGERVKPVSVVRGTVVHGPFFHALSHHIGQFPADGALSLDGRRQFLVGITRQISGHFLLVENVLTEVDRRVGVGWFHVEGFAVERYLNLLKSKV